MSQLHIKDPLERKRVPAQEKGKTTVSDNKRTQTKLTANLTKDFFL